MPNYDVKFGIQADASQAKKEIKDIVVTAQKVARDIQQALEASKGSKKGTQLRALRDEMGVTAKEVKAASDAFALYQATLGKTAAAEKKLAAIRNDADRKKLKKSLSNYKSRRNKLDANDPKQADKIANLDAKIAETEKALAPGDAQVKKLTESIARLKERQQAMKPIAAEFVKEYGKAGEKAAEILSIVNHTANATDNLSGKANKVNAGFENTKTAAAGAAAAVDGLTTKEGKANTAKAQSAEDTKKEDDSLKGLLDTLSAYKTSLEAATNAGKDTANIEQRIADTTDQINQKFNFTPASENIADLVRRFYELKTAKDALEKAGVPKEFTDQYTQIYNDLATTKHAIQEYNRALNQTGQENKRAGKSALTLKSGLSGVRSVLNAVKKGFQSLAKHAHQTGKSFDSMSRTMKSNFKHLLSNITKYVFGFRSLFFLVRRLRKYLGEGIQDLVRYEKAIGKSKMFGSVNQSITQLKTSLLYLEHAWAAAFAPIITAVTPILTALIDKLAVVGNAIARFIGGLTGAKVVYNAIKVPADDYADSLDKAAGSAGKAAKKQKELNDRLAAFDDLIVLGKDKDPNNTGTGGGGGSANKDDTDYSKLFKIVSPDEGGLVQMLKDAWATADFTAIGELLKDKIIEMLDGINWEEIQQKVTRFTDGVGTFLEGLLGDPALYESIGRAAGNALNTIIHGVENLLKHTKNIKFGENLGKGINEFLKTTDFETAGKNINELITQITNNINDFVNTISSDDVVDAITDFLDGLNIGDIITKVGNCLLQVTDLTIEVLGKLIVKGGEKLGEQLWNEVTEGIDSNIKEVPVKLKPEIDATEHPFQALIEDWITKKGEKFIKRTIKLGDLIGIDIDEIGLLDLLGEKWDYFTQAVVSFPDNVRTIFSGLGEDIKSEFLTLGVSVWEWLDDRKRDIEDIYYRIEDVVEDIGAWFQSVGDIFTGSVNGITDDLDLLGTNFTDTMTDLKDNAVQKWEDLTSAAEEKWSLIKENISTAVDGIKTDAEEKFNTLRDNVQLVWSNIMGVAYAKWDMIKGVVSTKVKEVKDDALEQFNFLKDNIAKVWSNIAGTAYAKWDSIKQVLVNAVKSVAKALRDPLNNIIAMFENMANKVISGLKSFISKVNIPDITIGGKTFSIKASVANLQPIKFARVPELAQGAVIPPNREFMAVLGDQSHGTNVEAPLDTIKQAVAEVLANNGNAEVIQLLQQLIGVVENKTLTIGDKEIAKANARYTNQQRIIRGASF